MNLAERKSGHEEACAVSERRRGRGKEQQKLNNIMLYSFWINFYFWINSKWQNGLRCRGRPESDNYHGYNRTYVNEWINRGHGVYRIRHSLNGTNGVWWRDFAHILKYEQALSKHERKEKQIDLWCLWENGYHFAWTPYRKQERS